MRQRIGAGVICSLCVASSAIAGPPPKQLVAAMVSGSFEASGQTVLVTGTADAFRFSVKKAAESTTRSVFVDSAGGCEVVGNVAGIKCDTQVDAITFTWLAADLNGEGHATYRLINQNTVLKTEKYDGLSTIVHTLLHRSGTASAEEMAQDGVNTDSEISAIKEDLNGLLARRAQSVQAAQPTPAESYHNAEDDRLIAEARARREARQGRNVWADTYNGMVQARSCAAGACYFGGAASSSARSASSDSDSSEAPRSAADGRYAYCYASGTYQGEASYFSLAFPFPRDWNGGTTPSLAFNRYVNSHYTVGNHLYASCTFESSQAAAMSARDGKMASERRLNDVVQVSWKYGQGE